MKTFGAHISVEDMNCYNGFNAPEFSKDSIEKFNVAHNHIFPTSPPLFLGCGAGIPFMEIFSKIFPKAKYMLTGCAFNNSGPHCPNENIDLEYCRKLTTVVSLFLSLM